MRASLLLVVTFLTNRSTARPQEPPWQLWEDHHDGFDEAAWPQPFAVESIRNTYEGNDLPLQPQALYPDVDTAFLAYFSDSDHSNIDEEFPPPLSPVVPTELSSTEASIGIEYAEYVPETISYNQVPWETWPVDPPPKVFPFNCWQEDKDGYLCKDSQCQMGTLSPCQELYSL
jgi:hypothetical protein